MASQSNAGWKILKTLGITFAAVLGAFIVAFLIAALCYVLPFANYFNPLNQPGNFLSDALLERELSDAYGTKVTIVDCTSEQEGGGMGAYKKFRYTLRDENGLEFVVANDHLITSDWYSTYLTEWYNTHRDERMQRATEAFPDIEVLDDAGITALGYESYSNGIYLLISPGTDFHEVARCILSLQDEDAPFLSEGTRIFGQTLSDSSVDNCVVYVHDCKEQCVMVASPANRNPLFGSYYAADGSFLELVSEKGTLVSSASEDEIANLLNQGFVKLVREGLVSATLTKQQQEVKAATLVRMTLDGTVIADESDRERRSNDGTLIAIVKPKKWCYVADQPGDYVILVSDLFGNHPFDVMDAEEYGEPSIVQRLIKAKNGSLAYGRDSNCLVMTIDGNERTLVYDPIGVPREEHPPENKYQLFDQTGTKIDLDMPILSLPGHAGYDYGDIYLTLADFGAIFNVNISVDQEHNTIVLTSK